MRVKINRVLCENFPFLSHSVSVASSKCEDGKTGKVCENAIKVEPLQSV